MMLFVGGNKLSGMGQVMLRLQSLVPNSEYMEIGTELKKRYDSVFFFIPPFEHFVDTVKQLIVATGCTRYIVMTVCETLPVHKNYSEFACFPEVFVPSMFCQKLLSTAVPTVKWNILHHFAPEPLVQLPVDTSRAYTFYTIGNVRDPRKNIGMLIKAFQELDRPDARLLVKATGLEDVTSNSPRITVINGLISDKQMENIHRNGDCYVNCSHSEGVGMGAVEAALHNKPVIITDFGGLQEYVKTPWIVSCTPCEVGYTEKLFSPTMLWGMPDFDVLLKFMRECYDTNAREYDHPHTRTLMAHVATIFAPPDASK